MAAMLNELMGPRRNAAPGENIELRFEVGVNCLVFSTNFDDIYRMMRFVNSIWPDIVRMRCLLIRKRISVSAPLNMILECFVD